MMDLDQVHFVDANSDPEPSSLPTITPKLSASFPFRPKLGPHTNKQDTKKITGNLLKDELPDPDVQLHIQLTPTNTFHDFGKLPIEVRFMIWKLLHRGRKIFITQDGQMLRCRAPVPKLLQICQETRNEFKRHYTGPAHIVGYPTRYPALSRYYFDSRIDTVIVEHDFFLHYFQRGHLSQGLGPEYVGEVLSTLQSVYIRSLETARVHGPWKRLDPTYEPSHKVHRFTKAIIRGLEKLSSLRYLTIDACKTGLRFNYEEAEMVKNLTAMFKGFREQDPSRSEVEISVFWKCHRAGAVECERCCIGLTKEEVMAMEL